MSRMRTPYASVGKLVQPHLMGCQRTRHESMQHLFPHNSSCATEAGTMVIECQAWHAAVDYDSSTPMHNAFSNTSPWGVPAVGGTGDTEHW